jgi:hypothetical protein
MPSPLLPYAEFCAATYDPLAVARWQDSASVVHAYLSIINGVHCVGFEGTHDFAEWIVDFVCAEVPFVNHAVLGPVHLGMMRDVLSIYEQIAAYFASIGWPPYDLTGHSKGAGEVLLCHGVMKQIGHPPRRTVAFESPRVATGILRDYLAGEDITQTATDNIHGKDLVTQVVWGPTYIDMSEPLILPVPDSYNIPTKHEIPAVLAAVAALPDEVLAT